MNYYDSEHKLSTGQHFSRAQIRKLFQSCDKNEDEVLTLEELRAGLLLGGLSDEWELYSAEIKRFDSNSAAVLSMDELLLWMGLIDKCEDLGEAA